MRDDDLLEGFMDRHGFDRLEVFRLAYRWYTGKAPNIVPALDCDDWERGTALGVPKRLPLYVRNFLGREED